MQDLERLRASSRMCAGVNYGYYRTRLMAGWLAARGQSPPGVVVMTSYQLRS